LRQVSVQVSGALMPQSVPAMLLNNPWENNSPNFNTTPTPDLEPKPAVVPHMDTEMSSGDSQCKPQETMVQL
jgi:hypothetical protein